MSRESRQATGIVESQAVSDLELSDGERLLENGQQNQLYDRMQLLWDERGFLARFTGAGVLCFLILSLIIAPKYESTTRLMPPESDSEGFAMLAALAGKGSDSSLGDLAGDVLGMKNSGALFVGILHSRTVENALIERFDLRSLYGTKTWDSTRKELENRTVIWEDRKSGIIEARVRDQSPERAQALTRAYVEELDRAVSKLSTSAARREREFLGARLQEVKHDLDQASQDFSQFASHNTAIDIPAQARAMVESAAVLQGQLMAAEAEAQGLKQIYTSNNVRVRSLDSRIAELRHQLDLLGRAGTGQDSPVATGSGTGSDSSTNSDEGSLYPSIRKLPILGVTYFDLYRRAKIQEALYEALTKRYEMAKVQEAKEIPTVRVLDAADLPEKKISPQRTLIVLSGLVFSLAVGCGWVIGGARWRNLSADDHRKLLVYRVRTDAKRDWIWIKAAVSRFTRKGHDAEG